MDYSSSASPQFHTELKAQIMVFLQCIKGCCDILHMIFLFFVPLPGCDNLRTK